MDPVTAQLITKLVEVVVPMLFSRGNAAEAEEIQRLHSDAQKNWQDLEAWANALTRPPAGPFR